MRQVAGDSDIRRVLEEARTIAVVGASHKPERPSHYVMAYLMSKGYRCFPVNPGLAGKTILGQAVYPDLAAISEPVDIVDVFRASDAVPGIVEEALAMTPRPSTLWLQLGVSHPEAELRGEAAGCSVVRQRCPKIEIPRLFGSGWKRGD